MGWNNPDVPWQQLNRALSWKSPEQAGQHGDGGDAPGWSRHREPERPERPPVPEQTGDPVPYAELHCHSNFSFLDGASQPEQIVAAAAALRLSAVAITDHDGMYGVVRFSQAAKEVNVPTIFGSELSLGLTERQNGVADPEGSHLLVIARSPEGYRRLSRGISSALLASGEKGRPDYRLDALAAMSRDHWLVLTGCRKGTVRQAIAAQSTAAGAWDAGLAELTKLVKLFGRGNVAVELIDHGNPTDSETNDLLAELAAAAKLPTVATGNVHYAIPQQRRLATALAAVRARRSLDEMDGWLPAAATAHLRSGAEMDRLFARYPGAVARAAEFGMACAFDLSLVEPELPPREVPAGHTEASYLRELAYAGWRERFGGKPHFDRAKEKIDYELEVIESLNFPGYFLIVKEIVDFCAKEGILVQGRGSAANSAVCFALGITAVDAVHHRLLFERFLAPERDGYPDIDLDIQSDRREEVIQHVYRKYGRQRAAQVANVISYRPKNAVRDIAKAFGYSPGQQDAWSKQIDHWGPLPADSDIPAPVIAMANELLKFPRHLGIHSGGMVLCDRPVSEVVPVEWASMENRTVVQWDKDDCADARLVKFDLLGLGMLTALSEVMRLVRTHHGEDHPMHTLDETDPRVYDMLCSADAVGVFQVESRAQLATLPRLRPRNFYDLVVEVALIRPGPIQGGSVHPYLRRRSGKETITYPHKKLQAALERTLGVPLFQEQLMQMAITIGNFDGADADRLRRAMGSKRSEERMQELKGKLYAGMADNGITGTAADDIYQKLEAFSHFGFPESHAFSFAKLVYASAYFKLYFPAAFCAALLNAQPMGFYSPQSLIADARRHSVTIRGVDINASLAKAKLEPVDPTRYADGVGPVQAVRLGIESVRTVGKELAQRIEDERLKNGPYADMPDVARRVGLTVRQAEALATAGAFGCFGLTKREALWVAGAAAQERADRLPIAVGARPPMLPGMADVEEAMAEVWATGMSAGSYPTEFAREYLDSLGVLAVDRLSTVDNGRRVRVAGVVTHRQRPATAGGITFMNLEDETGMVNVVCSPGLWAAYRRVAHVSPALLVFGKLERVDAVVNVVAYRLERLQLRIATTSRNFR
ncbi:error-prone DNA polymerase [Fodinicola acaciae]|uniref:error-prone DNA polymerase n=1 Tax=Fodinicola acaciae TaxID=2681555 RepID=UPI0013D8BEBD|nr:error-prone DNA polymerase [Fodinicola acaciae]